MTEKHRETVQRRKPKLEIVLKCEAVGAKGPDPAKIDPQRETLVLWTDPVGGTVVRAFLSLAELAALFGPRVRQPVKTPRAGADDGVVTKHLVSL